MADSQSSRDAGETAHARDDSQLRLVRPPVVVPEGEVPASDDAPTIISKGPPLQQAIQKANPNDFFSGSLRGRSLAHFELLEPIGVGGMAAVIRARDKQLDRLVALKILPPDMAKDVENVQRFHQEARAAAKLDHENIARVFFCGEDQNLHFIAFEFVEGENLRTILDHRGRIPVPQAVRYMLQIAAGLEHAAARGVVHRDVKPSNIIISPSGRAKLVDMGLARNMGPQAGGLTQSGVTLGTFDYISPEQALEPREADTRSDIYSLGCTFYHMLTGQSPVPEGTAAKKLHHHQQVPPIDPRQLNPAIPDDVAAIVGRMMAKDPKDRYQHPIHLVQHLMQVAQKVGAADDVPEGVLFVDAPLPSAPRKRPLVVMLSALLGLGGILLLLSLLNPGPQFPSPLQPSTRDQRSRDKAVDKSGLPQTVNVGGESERERFTRAFTSQDPKTTFELKGHIELEKSLEFDNPGGILIKSNDPEEARTIKMEYPEQAQNEWAGLWIKRGRVTFENIDFELATVTPKAFVAAIAVAAGGQVEFQNCTFLQKGVKIDRKFLDKAGRASLPVASVALLNPDNNPSSAPQVWLKGCYFQRGQVAASLNGFGKLQADNCAFSPHGALVHLRGSTGQFESQVHFERCSAHVVHGPAFRVDDDARAVVKLEKSILSCPETWISNRQDAPDLIRQTASHSIVRYVGGHNCFHNLNLLVVRPNENGIGHHQIAEVSALPGDADSVKLPLVPSPWAVAEPHKILGKHEAFQLDVKLPELARLGPVGLEYFVNQGPLGQAGEVGPVLAGNKTKIVDPDAAANALAGTFKTIDQALAYAKPGDEILIKHPAGKRTVEVLPTRFKPDAELTIKAHPNFSPILTLARTDEPDAAFFHLHDQKIVFENLEFELELDQPFNSLSVVSIDGNGSCTFRRCVLTLKESREEKPRLSIATLLKPEKMMEMGGAPRPSMPVLVFEACFVRGEGKLLTVDGVRPSKLRLENTLLALGGSLVALTSKEAKEGALPQTLALELKGVSSFLSEPLVQLRAGKTAKALLASVDAESNLFVALNGKALITLDAADGSELKLPGVVSWQGRKNAYSGYDGLRSDPEGWRMFAMEESRFLKVQFGPRPAQLSRALPHQFRALSDPPGELLPGADLDLLPRLTPASAEPPDENNDAPAPSTNELSM